jgi:hypothetical protein
MPCFRSATSLLKCKIYNSSWREDSLLGDNNSYTHDLWDGADYIGSSTNPWAEFEIVLKQYRLREFTDGSDALNALEGFLRRFEFSMACPFLQGLPRSFLNYYLLFTCRDNEDNDSHAINPRRKDLPSYTWVRWRRTAEWSLGFGNPSKPPYVPFWDWLEQGIWITFYILQPDGSTENVLGFTTQEPEFALPHHHLKSRTAPMKSPPFNLPNFPTQPTRLPEGVCRTYPMLQFWAMTARYKIIKSKAQNPYLFSITSRVGQSCGDIELDDIWDSNTLPHEFLILSQAQGRDKSYYRPNSHEADCNYDSFFVMLIIRDADGVAKRRGIGKVLQSSLYLSFEPGPRWEEIILG